ncbi:MAG: hypothetical protein HND52_08715 [Ignavibacteriae bacterium]|nr:hypothetical protein [Ignavibacteriota bacterium]NOG98032.1 hypothetical protein [Ignavibacteriota bacterium]
MLKFLISSLALFIIFDSASSQEVFAQRSKSQFSISPFIKLNSYGWSEFGDSGNELLSESGFIFSFGSSADYYFTKKKNLFINSELHIYLGKVDYDGFLFDPQTGQQQPYKNKTGYFGLELSANTGMKIKTSKTFYFTPIGGLGIEFWTRDLDDGGQYGYDEDYTAILFNLGLRGDYSAAKNLILFSMIMLKVPISLSEYVDASSRGLAAPVDVNLNPGKSPRIHIEVGTKVSGAVFTAFFETWTLHKSPPDKTFHQPESTRTWFGVKAAYEFWL